ncbi:hypothetical protein MLD38_039649 [Melastoma candidum]|nr:hypothetical protein MLD38_039649 [Melastoma candidum]
MEEFLKDDRSPEISSAASSDSSCGSRGRGCSVLPLQPANARLGSIFGCHPTSGFDLNYARMVIAEMVGTFVLMFCVSAVIAITQITKGEVGLAEYAMTAGMTIVVLVYSIGPISGAHINPVITLAFAAFGQFPWSRVPLYVFAQIVGSVIGTCIGGSIYEVKTGFIVTRPLQGGSTSAFCVEMFATFMIVLVIASMAYNHQSVGHLTGFVAGIAIGLAVLITGPISGGSMNPARSLGPAIVSGDYGSLWIYILAPLIGAAGGATLYRFLRLEETRHTSAPAAIHP